MKYFTSNKAWQTTLPAHNRLSRKVQTTSIKDIKCFTCTASKTTHQDNSMIEMIMPWLFS